MRKDLSGLKTTGGTFLGQQEDRGWRLGKVAEMSPRQSPAFPEFPAKMPGRSREETRAACLEGAPPASSSSSSKAPPAKETRKGRPERAQP